MQARARTSGRTREKHLSSLPAGEKLSESLLWLMSSKRTARSYPPYLKHVRHQAWPVVKDNMSTAKAIGKRPVDEVIAGVLP